MKKIPLFLLIISLFVLQALPAFANNKTIYRIPEYSGFKSFEYGVSDNGIVFDKKSKQYRLQKRAVTRNGFRKIGKRYMIAVGTRISKNVGDKVDLILKNGTRIPCIVGDIKAPDDTDETNTFSKNGCCSEFIMDTRTIKDHIAKRGDVSVFRKKWRSPVCAIIKTPRKNI